MRAACAVLCAPCVFWRSTSPFVRALRVCVAQRFRACLIKCLSRAPLSPHNHQVVIFVKSVQRARALNALLEQPERPEIFGRRL